MKSSTLLGAIALVPAVWAQCAIDAATRIDCGNATTTQASCTATGCCWNPLPAGQAGPACFYSTTQLTNPAGCPAGGQAAANRIDCGAPGMNQGQCIQKGCCWNPLATGVAGPWCYTVPSPVVNRPAACPATPMTGTLRVDCGNANSTQNSCYASGCCWDTLPAGQTGPNCYQANTVQRPAACPATPRDPTLRTNCGNATTTPASCAALGCCWDTIPAGTAGPNCYTATAPRPAACPATPRPATLRVDCGNANTTPDSCAALGCCWDPLPAGTAGPYCYSAATPRPPTCPLTPLAPAYRFDCGNATSTPDSCAASGCCWDTLPAGQVGPNCYNAPNYCPVKPTPGNQRIDCGNATTTQAQCVTSGCCWSPLGPTDIPGPTCYKFLSPVDTGCPVTPVPKWYRIDCGDASTTALGCVQTNCCWDITALGTGPNCYTKQSGLPASPPPPIPTPPPQDPNTGNYSVLYIGATVPIHLYVAPVSNKVILLERIFGGVLNTTHSYELDVTTATERPLHVITDIFCSAGVILPVPAATLINTGGWSDVALYGVRAFNPCGSNGVSGTCDWVENNQISKLQVPRWYPTSITLSNGQLVVMGGLTAQNVAGGLNQPTYEFLPPNGPHNGLRTMQLLVDTNTFNLYPIANVMPDGKVMVSARDQHQLFDQDFNLLSALPNSPREVVPNGGRTYPMTGMHALLPLDPANNYAAKYLVCGGGSDFPKTSPALSSCTTLDYNSQSWSALETMPIPRVMGDMVTLADGTVLMINGAQQGSAGFNLSQICASTALHYDPTKAFGQRITVGGTTKLCRLYHALAVLLPDARVLIAGSTPNTDSNGVPPYVTYPAEKTVEIYTPAYINKAPRPVISPFANTFRIWKYNTKYSFASTLPSGNAKTLKVSLVQDQFVTHSVHMGQRYVYLTATYANGVVTITTPPNSFVLPPGWYMIFVLDNGVPSVAEWVLVGNEVIDPSVTAWVAALDPSNNIPL